jgi:ribonucleoside-diphosphate reductase beta chain
MASKYTVFPVKHDDLWQMYKKAVSNFWVAEEMRFDHDLKDWVELHDNERNFLTMVLAFFAASDGIVAENLATKFYTDCPFTEGKMFIAFQIFMESIHGEVYSLLINEYVKDEKEKDRLFNAIEEIPSVQRKAEWALKWINDDQPYALRLLAYMAVEGVFFSASFCAIFWMNSRGLLPGLCQSNNLIALDEASHVDFSVVLYNKLFPTAEEGRIPQTTVHELFKDAIDTEIQFVKESLPDNLLGMNATDMCAHVEYCADRLMIQLGYDVIYGRSNVFTFMENGSLPKKTSFFERVNSRYLKARVGDASDISNIDLNADF